MGLPLTDAAGVVHAPAGADARIVSLVPSVTELLFDLGLGDAVVGRTAYCRHPAGRVRAARSVGGTKTVNMDKLMALRPTHALVNIDENPRALAEDLAARGLTVVVTHPVEVRDNLALYRLLGGIFGRPAEAEALCRRFDAAWHAAAADWPVRRVLYLIWKEPWMTVSRDTYISRMLDVIGWRTCSESPADRYPAVALEPATLDAVDLVLFSSEPFPFKERHLAAFREAFPAHARKALAVDGEMISWYGSRAIAGLAYLRALALEQVDPSNRSRLDGSTFSRYQ